MTTRPPAPGPAAVVLEMRVDGWEVRTVVVTAEGRAVDVEGLPLPLDGTTRLSRDGRCLTAVTRRATGGGTLGSAFDLVTGEVGAFAGDEPSLAAAAPSPDASRLAHLAYDRGEWTLAVGDSSGSAVVWRERGPWYGAPAVSWSPDSRYLACSYGRDRHDTLGNPVGLVVVEVTGRPLARGKWLMPLTGGGAWWSATELVVLQTSGPLRVVDVERGTSTTVEGTVPGWPLAVVDGRLLAVGPAWPDEPSRLVTSSLDGEDVEPLLELPPGVALASLDVAPGLVDLGALTHITVETRRGPV